MHVTKETFMPHAKNKGKSGSLIDTSNPPPTPLKIVLILTNSADPEEIPPYAVLY